MSGAPLGERPGIGYAPGPRKAASAIKQLFRAAKLQATDKKPPAGPLPHRRKRGEDTGGGFRFAAAKTLRRTAETTRKAHSRAALAFFGDAAGRSNERPRQSVAENVNGPMSAGELIAWYRANGYSMEAIRKMFPGLFQDPAPEPIWGPPTELDDAQRQQIWYWNDLSAMSHVYEAGHFDADASNHLYPQP